MGIQTYWITFDIFIFSLSFLLCSWYFIFLMLQDYFTLYVNNFLSIEIFIDFENIFNHYSLMISCQILRKSLFYLILHSTEILISLSHLHIFLLWRFFIVFTKNYQWLISNDCLTSAIYTWILSYSGCWLKALQSTTDCEFLLPQRKTMSKPCEKDPIRYLKPRNFKE